MGPDWFLSLEPKRSFPRKRLLSSPCPPSPPPGAEHPPGLAGALVTQAVVCCNALLSLCGYYTAKKCLFFDLVIPGRRSSPFQQLSCPAAILHPCPGGEQKRRHSPGGSLCHLPAPGLMQALPQTLSYQGCGFSLLLLFLQQYQRKPACPTACPTACPRLQPLMGLQQPWVRPGKCTREAEMSLDFLLAWRLPRNLILFVFTADK